MIYKVYEQPSNQFQPKQCIAQLNDEEAAKALVESKNHYEQFRDFNRSTFFFEAEND